MRFPGAVFLAACIVGAASCQEGAGPIGGEGGVTGDPSPTTSIVSPRWPFWPTRMRFHPLTLLANDVETGKPIIETRVEFVDQFGSLSKAVAQFRFELHAQDPQEGPGQPLREWNIDLRDPDQNSRHFDTVTRTYLFRLALESMEQAQDAFLRVYVLSVDQRKFTATTRLK